MDEDKLRRMLYDLHDCPSSQLLPQVDDVLIVIARLEAELKKRDDELKIAWLIIGKYDDYVHDYLPHKTLEHLLIEVSEIKHSPEQEPGRRA